MFKKIKLSRTEGDGSGPTYDIEVFPDGRVHYNGGYGVEKMGEHQWTISEEKVKHLVELIEGFNFKNFEYETEMIFALDLPSCITEIIFEDGTEKKMDHYLGDTVKFDRKNHRMKLETFEKRIEEIVGTDKYVEIKPY
ncbi:hypothetical protein CEY16_07875 [Halalkalibacillus sediminis]|uniref:DUF6438 domain-containing protein n=1 Tax=Halalkalibacillus sediminis TaxID=2018042 RepID=A0A2I0QU54_9BACI|nr:DUF6438 domain-containing protein [Halalkalibacillus sediminis]PKR77838.1 hypothetical protein CEY16_07875 [Halalkalibacillus sediminis]